MQKIRKGKIISAHTPVKPDIFGLEEVSIKIVFYSGAVFPLDKDKAICPA